MDKSLPVYGYWTVRSSEIEMRGRKPRNQGSNLVNEV